MRSGTLTLKSIVYIFVFFSSLFTAKAQSREVNGYYINQQEDTIKGVFNNYRNWEKNPSVIGFVTGNSQPITLTPANCKKVYIEGFDTYIAYEGKRLINGINFVKALQQLDSTNSYSQVSTFLRVVFEGKKFSLLEFEDNIRTNFFIVDEKGVVTELLYKLYNDGENHIVSADAYKNQLQFLIPELQQPNHDLVTTLQSLNYDARSFKNFLNKFTKTNHISSPKRIPVQIILTGGGAFNLFKVSGTPEAFVATGKYNSQFSPLIGIGAVFYNQRNFGKIFFYPNVRYYSFSNTGNSTNGQIKNEFSSSVVYIQASAGINIFNQEYFKWYVSGGAGIGLLVNNRDLRTVSGNRTVETDFNRNSAPLFELQTGIALKHIGFFVGYIPKAPVVNYVYYNARHSSLQAGINWRLNIQSSK